MQHNNIRWGWWMLPVLITGVLAGAACNKGFDRVLDKKDFTDTTRAIVKNPKVLLVIIDGARGQSVRDANTVNIMGLTAHAIFSWNTVTDTLISDYTTWADILTGVHRQKHSIEGNTLDNNNLNNFPVFFKRIKERSAAVRIAAFSSSNALGNNLVSNADMNKVFSDDDNATTTAAVNELGVDSAGLVMVQYNGVDLSGAQYGYDLSVPQYRNAILQADDNIGKLLTAMKARKSFGNENWMVVVMSNHGGAYTVASADDDHTILSNPKVNNFIIFYSPLYMPSFIDKPYTGNRYIGKGVHLYGTEASAVYATINDVNHNYDFDNTLGFTVEMKIKVQPGANGDYTYSNTPVLTKRTSLDPGNVGWAIVLNQKGWQFNLGQNVPGKTDNIVVSGSDISDGNWHDVAAVITVDTAAKTRTVRTFTDGTFKSQADISNAGNFNNPAPLTLGYFSNTGSYPAPDVYVTEIKLWLAAATDQTIGQYACETTLPNSHPLKDKKVGYWPAKDGQGGVLKDQSTIITDFKLQGPYNWFNFNDLICPASPSNIASLMPQSVDVSRQVLDWLQIPSDLRWNLDGRVWTTKYVAMNNN
ncbi:DUF4983 domain-containing protein [Chitinophaga sp. 30R24]|uniref:DUF4983 domain-containing protein n=1 Tax=Chitinophaga sp. 30R24 TaxID=3248838 RepID=UPI003B8FDEB8